MTIKQYVLDALGKFWTKLKSTYVTNCASTSNNLALAASQGKVLQDQITALNSSAYLLTGGKIMITANTDLNTLIDVGEYALTQSAQASTIQNKPSGLNVAFRLRVELMTSGNNNYLRQTITTYASSVVYTRYTTNGGSSWANWETQPTRSEFDALNSKIVYENFSVQIEFEAGTPSSYVSVQDIPIAKPGYTPISVSLRSVPGAAGLNIYSLQFAITTGTARIAYGRNGTGAAYSNTVGISVVYIKTS